MVYKPLDFLFWSREGMSVGSGECGGGERGGA